MPSKWMRSTYADSPVVGAWAAFGCRKGKVARASRHFRVRTIQETHGAEGVVLPASFREACGLGLIPKSPRVLQAVCTEADDAVMQNGPPPPESYRVTASLLFSTDRVGIDSFGIDGLEKASARSMHHASGVRTYKDATLMEPWPLLPLGGMQSPSVSPFERR